jgi:hypothetical protein
LYDAVFFLLLLLLMPSPASTTACIFSVGELLVNACLSIAVETPGFDCVYTPVLLPNGNQSVPKRG